MIDTRGLGRNILLVLLAAKLLACGEGPSGYSPTDKLALDTITFRAELDSARIFFRTGRVQEADSLLRPILRHTNGVPELRKQRMHALALKGQIHQRSSQLDSAMLYNRELMAVAVAASDTFWIAGAHTNIGVVHEIRGEYAEALKEGLASLHLKELRGDSIAMARTLHNISLLQWRRDSLVQALDFLQRSIAIKRKLDPGSVHSSLNGLGVLLIEAGELDSAVVVLKESLAKEDSLDDGAEREMQLSNLGLVFERKGMLDSAAHFYSEALDFSREHGNYEVEIRSLYGLGDVRRAQGRYNEAKALLDSSLAISKRIDSMEDMKEAHISLVYLYEHLNDPANALRHFRSYHTLRDTLMNAEVTGRMAELGLRYDSEKKDRENAELRAQQELAELRADRNSAIAIGTGMLALALIVLGWTMLQRNRQRARQREAELEQQALRLQMDPHFLFNALNTVPGLYASGDPAAANDHVGHLSKFLRLVLETSRRRTISLAQELELVEHYLQICANRRPDKFTWELKVMPYVRPDRLAVPPMLIQPVVENALEHGFKGVQKGHLSVLVDLAGSVLHLEVQDNGIGRKAAAQRPSRHPGASMGIDLVRQRIMLFDKHANGSDAVQVKDGSPVDPSRPGTTVTLRFRPQIQTEHAEARDR
ncbi:MAG: tetratricopeptide repeat protein [Flavobacteriales bacterium]|nr:tetratricopeptide repeat protein [Flavobacteriales bacterium]